MENLLQEIQTISKRLAQPIPSEIHLMKQYLVELSSMKARVNDISPDAHFYFSQQLAKVTELILTTQRDSIKGNSALIKNMIAGKMATPQKLLDYVDRVSSTINLQSDNIRTVLSFEKELLRNNLH